MPTVPIAASREIDAGLVSTAARGLGVLVISHDLQSIFGMADYVAMLFEGAIIAYDTAAAIRNSRNPIVQQFLAGSEVGPIPI